NPVLDETEILDGCQLGLTVDGRCNSLLCKYRIDKDQAPDEILPQSVMCPREREHELEHAAVICEC
ncbi:MAG: hypothetical protein KAX31_05480, partial [Thermoplasmata archaeon]|nr:hypothetical protein [Thermoplasmata archaeon]